MSTETTKIKQAPPMTLREYLESKRYHFEGWYSEAINHARFIALEDLDNELCYVEFDKENPDSQVAKVWRIQDYRISIERRARIQFQSEVDRQVKFNHDARMYKIAEAIKVKLKLPSLDGLPMTIADSLANQPNVTLVELLKAYGIDATTFEDIRSRESIEAEVRIKLNYNGK